MPVRIALMITAFILALGNGPARAALDPGHAPIASVDRFSDTAGTLLKRSADKRLPGRNEPIDFDAQPLNTLGLSPKGEPTLYYHLDVQSTTPAPVYVLYREGEAQPVEGQLDVIDTLPGESLAASSDPMAAHGSRWGSPANRTSSQVSSTSARWCSRPPSVSVDGGRGCAS